MSKLKYVVPNLFTIASMLLGLASVTRAAEGDFSLAAWMILWGVLLDKLDGTAARLLKASTKIGAQLDSFADFVIFGIAPAALYFYRLRATGDYEGAATALLAVACALHVVAAAGRLARFNISEPPLGDRLFYGVPSTLMGAVLASTYLTWEKYSSSELVLLVGPALLVVGAGLMVSNLRLPKLKSRRNRAFNIFQIANIVVAYVFAPLMLFPEYLLTLAVAYTIGGVAWCLAFPPEAPDESPQRELAA
jgi:CDP-diacylglycerol--serine O-phosphatidyltransferase